MIDVCILQFTVFVNTGVGLTELVQIKKDRLHIDDDLFSYTEVVELFENISIAALAIAFGVSLVLFTIKLIYAAQHMHLYAKTGGCNL